jgi:hypothetical protein
MMFRLLVVPKNHVQAIEVIGFICARLKVVWFKQRKSADHARDGIYR